MGFIHHSWNGRNHTIPRVQIFVLIWEWYFLNHLQWYFLQYVSDLGKREPRFWKSSVSSSSTEGIGIHLKTDWLEIAHEKYPLISRLKKKYYTNISVLLFIKAYRMNIEFLSKNLRKNHHLFNKHRPSSTKKFL